MSTNSILSKLRQEIAQLKGVKLYTFSDILSDEPVADDLEEAAKEYCKDRMNYDDSLYFHRKYLAQIFIAGAKWQKEQMMKMITKDDNLEEAGVQYVETYFRDNIDWTPDVIKSCLEEAFISGGEYVLSK